MGSPRKGILVYNPKAGARDRRDEVREAVERSRSRGLELLAFATERPGHATELVRQHVDEAPDVVVAGGGDGTVAEVARAYEALARHGTALAILPLGTVNVVAREYRIGTDPAKAEELFLSPNTRRLTVWQAGDRASLIGVGVGFDARVMARSIPILKKLFGRGGYGITATLEWLKYEFPRLTVTGLDADGAPFSREATFLIAANTARYGGDPLMSPFADPESDLVDLVLVTFTSTVSLFRFYARLSRGKAEQLRLPGVTRMPVRCFSVESRAGYPVEVQVDGDCVGLTPIVVERLGSLPLLVP